MTELQTCYNSALIHKNELAKNTPKALIKGSDTLTLIPIVFYIPTFQLVQTFAIIQTPVPAQPLASSFIPIKGLPDIYTNINL